jgi:DNA-binding MarR family transcriptional regulator
MFEVSGETRELALRFLRVMEFMGKFASHRVPDSVVGQLNINQLRALHMLRHEAGMAQKDLAERLQITPAAISNAVRDMEGLELIERLPDASDARLMRLHLTSEGQRIIAEGQEIRCAAMADLLSALPPDEQRMVVEALERALAAKQPDVTRTTYV